MRPRTFVILSTRFVIKTREKSVESSGIALFAYCLLFIIQGSRSKVVQKRMSRARAGLLSVTYPVDEGNRRF
ncbi:uncharacterized protein K460DRAFT_13811 [Cucurbitaria berberidis CBS 394.84]|uniref:Uncharacterized protein n=1 Tax=Cucurbitaria berberidis CBS 394.84 TaxID=1168544 RepID=A0A9P4GRR1_9PLEO|nr:uncharacterized protein K460DRAFT_13811 [Cucurbitaria berberidis CBS 394.84]KAF1850319.1 hypothetical protein K460DRAFT_13811 [Cucurbitaria berberidis CBS 394.84]